MKIFSQVILYAVFSLFAAFVQGQNVWTQHNDQGRTGWYPYESILNTNNVNKNTFGLYFDHITDDKVVSQPLVVMNVNIPNVGLKNVVFVTTLNNSIYAYDADVNAAPYWSQNYTNKTGIAPAADCIGCRPAYKDDIHPSLCGGGYGDFSGNMGIIGTPVIDTLAGTMYFVTKVVNPNDGVIDNHSFVPNQNDEYNYTTTGFHQYLHAIDITTGIDRPNSPVEITATSNGTGDGQTATNSGVIKFNPRTQFNRAGLVLRNGKIYIAFAAHCDFNPSHGWVIGYNATTLTYFGAYNPTPNDGRGGIWMSGTAPAVDAAGSLYITTGNSLNEDRNTSNYNTYNTTFATDPANRGESVIKLDSNLILSSWFTPYNYIALNQSDLDFPIQVMLLPNTNLAMTGCKDHNLYIMDQTDMGGFNLSYNNVKQVIDVGNGSMHSSFAYFGGPIPYAYQFSEGTQLKAYPVSAAGLGAEIVNTNILGPSAGGSGGFLSVSSQGIDPTTGILWAYHNVNNCNSNNADCHALLHAVKASDITQELWNSDMVTADNIPVFNKFSCPTIALGKVFIAANKNHLLCYGLKTNTSCVTNVALGKPATALTTSSGTANNVTDGDLSTGWTANPTHDVDSIYIDLQASYDICKIAITWQSGGYGQDFDVKISDDKLKWTIVSSVRGNTLLYNELNKGVTGRYVSMVGIKRGTGAGYAMYEFQVYGSPASSCRAPIGLTAASLSPSSEHISWDAVSGVNQYLVKYRSNLAGDWISRTITTNAIDLVALTCGYLYYYTIQADCGSVQSAVSNGSFTTASCPTNSCTAFPVRHYHLDIGDIGVAGTTCKGNNIWNITGSGTDIGGISDQFQFAYTNNDIGNYHVSGRIIGQNLGNASNKFGIMARDSLTKTSRFAFLASVNQGNTILFEYRDQPGGPVTTIQAPGHYSIPFYFRIYKTGTSYAPVISTDGITWTPVFPSVDLHFGTDPTNIPNYGMAMSSLNNSSLSTGQIDNFSLLVSAPLPIQLLNFTAKNIKQDHVLISWTTTMEHLTDKFEIQRSGDNGTFNTIDKINAAGESETERSYSVNDNDPLDGVNYYRLKETDKDGKSYLSPVVSVLFNGAQVFEMAPNPVENFTNIHLLKGTIEELTVYDESGKLIQRIRPGNSLSSIRLNTSEFPGGVYFISVKTKTSVYKQKMIKK